MVNAHYDLLLTMSTLSLQAVANANRGTNTVHVFGLVADPVVAGVGISRNNPLDHPRKLVGIGSFLPVQDAFHIAKEMFPPLKKVGVAWNPAEANSRAFVEKAGETCKQSGIELLEENVENSRSYCGHCYFSCLYAVRSERLLMEQLNYNLFSLVRRAEPG
jgi:ABC-type uncharacterized transport system substrate-binding protein